MKRVVLLLGVVVCAIITLASCGTAATTATNPANTTASTVAPTTALKGSRDHATAGRQTQIWPKPDHRRHQHGDHVGRSLPMTTRGPSPIRMSLVALVEELPRRVEHWLGRSELGMAPIRRGGRGPQEEDDRRVVSLQTVTIRERRTGPVLPSAGRTALRL